MVHVGFLQRGGNGDDDVFSRNNLICIYIHIYRPIFYKYMEIEIEMIVAHHSTSVHYFLKH